MRHASIKSGFCLQSVYWEFTMTGYVVAAMVFARDN